TKVVSEVSGIEHSFPYYVARDEGYFAEEGLDVELVRSADSSTSALATRNFDLLADHKLADAFAGGAGTKFEAGGSALYRACEWGQVRRSYDSKIGAQVTFKRSHVGTQAIVVRPDAPYNIPQDLADVPVGVSFHHGSHYVAIQSLEGFLEPEEIKVVGIKGVNRFYALRDKQVDAIATMEPWITVAEKLGYKVIVEAHYGGLEIVSADLDPEVFAAINRAISKAARKLMNNPYPYLHYLIEEVPPEVVTLVPQDFSRNRLRYVDPQPYSQKDFERTYRWMVRWGLIGDDSGYGRLVDTSTHEIAKV
ncbi:MAG TPA: ABC transporter substrate-binding protein, partial [Acidimicrobiales bacterium]|nr:ABC transporter substrate-binding protein [Acidimicrobiales bacterium]